jgi:hypothetical protein
MTRVEPKQCKGFKVIEYSENILTKIDEIKEAIANNKAVIIKGMYSQKLLKQIRQYLFNLGLNSLPSYHALDHKIPDHHLILQHHPDSYVDSYAHKFYFYPWNQNIFDFFEIFKKMFQIKNLISGLDSDKYLSANPVNDDFVIRCLFHHYPSGGGYIAKHTDTVGVHQSVTSIAALSDKGTDYKEGGLYLIDENDDKIYVDDYLQMGSVVFFNPEMAHGVDEIIGNKNGGFFDISGRWIMIGATIKTARNKFAKTAIQL